MSDAERMHALQNALASAQLSLEVVLRYECSEEEKSKLLRQAFEAVQAAQALLHENETGMRI